MREIGCRGRSGGVVSRHFNDLDAVLSIMSPRQYSGSIVSKMQASIDRTVAWSITSRCWWQKSIDGSAVAKPWETRVIVPAKECRQAERYREW
jgi:hypothetical protein